MKSFIGKRAIASGVSLVVLIVIVFFLSRLTGDPTDLYLPIDATTEMRQQFREMNGFNDPLIIQFGRYVSDLAQGNFGQSLRQARPAMDVVLEAFVWTFWLAVITMALVTVAAIVIGSLAAFRVGGVFDRLATFFSLIGAAAQISGWPLWRSSFSPSNCMSCRHRERELSGTGSCRSACCSSGLSA